MLVAHSYIPREYRLFSRYSNQKANLDYSKTAPKEAENFMFLFAQSIGRPPPIVFPSRTSGSIEATFFPKTNTFSDRRKEVITWRYFALRKPVTTR